MDKLRQLRTQAGITQNGLAKSIGKAHSYVWAVESGKTNLTARDTIRAWAEALGVDPDEVYRAINLVPHDIIDELQKADIDTWVLIRKLTKQINEAEG